MFVFGGYERNVGIMQQPSWEGNKIICLGAKKFDRIDSCRQFHQHFSRAFFVRIFCQSQNVTRKSCRNDIRMKNSYVKMLIELTPVLTQIHIFSHYSFKLNHKIEGSFGSGKNIIKQICFNYIVSIVRTQNYVIFCFKGCQLLEVENHWPWNH